jgi:AcrR family transcriptional regulator
MASRMNRHRQETRERILTAAYDLFVRQGIADTTLEEICQHADVANRTFFNHYPTRQAMHQALADRRLGDVQALIDDRTKAAPARLIALTDGITVAMAGSSDAHPDLVCALISAAACQGLRLSRLNNMVVELVNDGVERGELTSRHEPQLLADIIVGALTAAMTGWTTGPTDQPTKRLHDLGVALAELLAPSRMTNAHGPNHHRDLALTHRHFVGPSRPF